MIKLALRNLLRNRRRTILSLLLIAFGIAALFLVRGYGVDIATFTKEIAIRNVWHLQIATEAYWEGERHGYDYLISPEVLAQVREILAEEPQVVSYATMLRMEGIIGTEQKGTAIFIAFGVEPANPIPVPEIKEGRGLEPDDLEAMLIERDLAEQLDLEVDDTLAVKARTVDGLYHTGNVKIAGIYHVEGLMGPVITPVSFNQMMRGTDRISTIAVKLADDGATQEVALRLQTALEDNALPGLKVKTWEDLADFHHQLVLFLNLIFGFIGLVIFVLVFFSVLEALTMAFFERVREVGTVRAIGTRRHQVFGMFLSEGVFLGLFSGLLGVVLGWGIGSLINSGGISYTGPLGQPVPLGIALGLDVAWAPFLLGLVATTISAIYPAYRAAKLEIASALRFV
ncbi:FtsX-like permease family protein [Dehalococcoidia bacterium]|nr:FtsX-like permease family protein [Dehalococcoidia bacterium]